MKMPLFLLCIISSLDISQAQEVNRPRIKSGTYYSRTTKAGVKIVVAYPKDWDGCPADDQIKFWWRNWRWDSKTDLEYAKATQEIDAAIKSGTTPFTLVKRYQEEVAHDKWNPLKNYRWAYSSWRARKLPQTKPESDTIIYPIVDQFSELKFPVSYHYARVGFLANAYKGASPHLKNLGERLLKRNTGDEDVKFYMIRVLANTFRPEDDKRALNYLSFFRNKYPKNTYYIRETANLRRRFFDRQYPLDQKKANAAILAFKNYASVAPTDYERNWANIMVRDIQTKINDWNRWERKYWLRENKRKS